MTLSLLCSRTSATSTGPRYTERNPITATGFGQAACLPRYNYSSFSAHYPYAIVLLYFLLSAYLHVFHFFRKHCLLANQISAEKASKSLLYKHCNNPLSFRPFPPHTSVAVLHGYISMLLDNSTSMVTPHDYCQDANQSEGLSVICNIPV